MTAKTKRDRAAGRAHRHTAIQTIIDNHEGIIDDIASIDNSIAALQGETCDLGTKLVIWTARLEEQNIHNRQNVAHAMQRVARNERKQTETESAVAILQHTSAEHQEAIAQLIAYTNKVNGRADALQQKTNLLRDELNETNKRLIQLAWVNTIIWLSAALTIFALLIVP